MSDTWPRTFVIVCHRGINRAGKAAKRPFGTIVNVWRESVYERMYAAGFEEVGSNSSACAWVQRIDLGSLEELDALHAAIDAKTATVSTRGIDAPTVATLQKREPFVNRGQDGRVRTVKGDLSLGRAR